MKKLVLILWMLFLFGISGMANAELIDRGGGLIYDDLLDITWLQDANYARTSGYDGDGLMTWSVAMCWATNSLVYYDSVRDVTWDDWRLPTTPGNNTGYWNEGEMGHLYYDENIYATHEGPFYNVKSYHYWTGQTQSGDEDNAYAFGFNSSNGGSQRTYDKDAYLYAWAVRDGDVGAPVPEPSTMLLLGAGLLGLIGIGRRKMKKSFG